MLKKYDITKNDQNLIEIALKCLNDNFDDGVYNHTVGCALLLSLIHISEPTRP